MGLQQLMPPAAGGSLKVNGRLYVASPGSVLVAPSFDADVLEANGWTKVANGGAGPSASRPANPAKGTDFHDQTLGKNIRWDGRTWRDPASGAAV